jgi:PAS domain S-box-containing protein
MEAKHADDDLRQSQADLAAAQRIAGVGSWRWDVRNDEGSWSDETYRIFGQPHERLEAHGTQFLEMIHMDDRVRVGQALKDAVDGTAEYDLEYRLTRPDGVERIIHAQAEVVRDEAGHPTVMRGTVHDITERKRAESDLADRLRFETLMADLSARFVNVPADQLDNEIEFAQRQVCECLGLDASSLWQTSAENPSILTLTHRYRALEGPPFPERMDAQVYFPWVYGQFMGGRKDAISVCSMEDLSPDMARDRESWRQLGVKSALMFSLSVGGGPVFGALSFNTMRAERSWPQEIVNRLQLVAQIFSNALARQRADRALRESEDRYRVTFQNIPAGVVVFELDGSVARMNAEAARLLDFSLKKLAGTELVGWESSAFREDGAPCATQDLPVSNCFRTAQPQADTVLGVRRPDGSIFYAVYSATPILDPASGRVLRAVLACRDVTGQKQAEAQLRKLSRAVEQSPSSVVITDPQGNIEYVNPRFTHLTGYTLEEALGKNPRILKSELTPATTYRELWHTVLRGGEWRGEFVNRKKSGELYWVSASISPIKNSRDVITHFVAVKEDITERKRTEEALAESRMLLNTIVDSTSDLIWSVDARFFGLLSFNQSLAEHFRKAGIFIEKGMRPKDLFPDDCFKQTWREFYQRALREGSFTTEYDTNINGRTLELSFALIRRAGAVFGVSVFGKDITKRKLAEKSLRASEAKFRAIVENSHDGIVFADANGVILYRSPSYHRINGFIDRDLVGHIGFETVHPDDLAATRSVWAEVLKHPGEPSTIQNRVRHKDGTWRWVESTAQSFLDDGSIQAVVMTTRDVTDRTRAQDELQRLLQQSRALAARSQNIREEERKRVAREIHDQLGQGLTAIKLDLRSLIRETTGDPPKPSERATSLLQLVDETIQTVRRIAAELRPGLLDDLGLVATIEWASEDFEVRTGIPCRLNLPVKDIEANSERATAVFRIFQETLTNVVRHAHATEVQVRLAQENGQLILEVHDNGSGIPPGKLSSGDSLGIIGMRERALLLGGELSIKSAPKEGTTVSLRICGRPPHLTESRHA